MRGLIRFFLLKRRVDFSHFWEEKKNSNGRRRATEESWTQGLPLHQLKCWAKWSPPPARHLSASTHTATPQQPPAQPQHQQRMAAAKTEMILPALQISEPLSFPHSPMDNYPKLEEVMMLSSAGTPFLTASAPEGAGFGSGEPGEQYEHLPGGKTRSSSASFSHCCIKV